MKVQRLFFATLAMVGICFFTNSFSLAQAQSSADIVPAASETLLACQTGDTVEINGTATLTGDFDTCQFQVDNATVDSHGSAAFQDTYHFRWTAQRAGDHTLKVVYTDGTQAKAVARAMIVRVTDLPPIAFQSLPTAAAMDTAVTVANTGNHFTAARVDFYFDGQPLAPSPASPFTVMLPLSAKTQAGTYPLRFVARDAAGRVFYSRTAQIVVPARFKISAPANFAQQKPEDRAPLTVDILPGVQAAKIAYFWAASGSDDWKPLPEISAAPFSAAFDLSAFSSGDYQVKATLTTVSGTAYEGDPVTIHFQNAAADEKAAREAKEKADADAALEAQAAKKKADADALVADAAHVDAEKLANLSHFVPRPGYDAKVFRQQIAELALASPPAHKGVNGMAQDLSLLQASGKGGGQNAPPGGLLSAGLPQPVSAVVSAGSGRLQFGGLSPRYAALAAQQAAEYCRTKHVSPHWDWSQHDITLYLPAAGSSAATGLAAAVAILSAASGHPVDDSVAMSGQVDAQGNVQPLPGVVYNAGPLFDGTHVQTLIVPAGAIGGDVLFSLYTHFPALCFNRRVILAHTVDAVANYALLRGQPGNAAKEEQLIEGGLRHFAAGDDTQASAAFRAASELDPDNWTAGFWLTMVSLVEQQKVHPTASADFPPQTFRL